MFIWKVYKTLSIIDSDKVLWKVTENKKIFVFFTNKRININKKHGVYRKDKNKHHVKISRKIKNYFFKISSESNKMVKGPSFNKDTSICAPNIPCATLFDGNCFFAKEIKYSYNSSAWSLAPA